MNKDNRLKKQDLNPDSMPSSSTSEIMHVKIKLEKTITILLFIILLVWFFPFITKGIDVQDTCSYLTKYRYIFDKSVKVNELFYLFAEVAGGIIYHIMPSHQVLALNVASWLCYSATAILIYIFLKDYMSRIPLLAAVLAGSFFGITWVHCLNWNAISMLLQTIGLMVLIKAMVKDSNKLIVLSGMIFAVNTFVRLPNILQLGLVCVVFWNYFMPEFNFKKAMIKSLWMVLGGSIGGILSIVISIGILGFGKFSDDILMLTSVSGGGESSHGLVRIVSLFYRGMLQGAGNWIKFGMFLVVFSIFLVLIEKVLKAFFLKEIHVISIAGTVIAAIFGMFLGLKADYIDVHVFVAFGAIILGTIAAFFYAKKDIIFSDMCLAAVIIEGILTIGTDTGSAYYRVYIGLPLAIIVCILIKLVKELLLYKDRKYKTLSELKKLQWKSKWLIPSLIMICMVTAGFSVMYPLAAGYHYATTFVYHDSANPYLVKRIKAKEFAGLKTSVERAGLLDRLVELLKPYNDYQLLQLGSFNAGCVITDMKPFFDSSWPDLEYLTMDRFNSQLEKGIEEGNYPVIVLGDMNQDKSGFWNMDKYEIAVSLGESEKYSKLYEDEWYVIYVPRQ
jgi:hypothetical protein